MKKKKSLSIIIKPTHDCNLSCKYCYVDKNAEQGKMNSNILEQATKKVSKFSQNSFWIWQGENHF